MVSSTQFMNRDCSMLHINNTANYYYYLIANKLNAKLLCMSCEVWGKAGTQTPVEETQQFYIKTVLEDLLIVKIKFASSSVINSDNFMKLLQICTIKKSMR